MQLPYRKPGKYQQEPLDPVITQKKKDEYEAELKALNAKRPHAAKEVARLAEMGDFSENVEYQLAKRRLRGINGAITKIEFLLNRADIIEPAGDGLIVDIGNSVTVRGEEGQERTYTILGSQETDPTKGIISHTSPLGSTLLGKRKDESFVFSAAGKEKKWTIISIS